MKTIIYLAMALLLVATATAYDMCGYEREINENCTMLTAEMGACGTYNYDIINATDGTTILTANLVNWNTNIYAFNLTQPEGDYLIRLCDLTTREVKVKPIDDNNMIIAAIVLIPMLLGFFLLIGAASLGDDHNVLRLFLFMISPIMFIVSLHFGVVALVKFYNFPELQDAIGNTVYWFGLILGVIITYFIIYLFIKMVHTMAENKKERLEY